MSLRSERFEADIAKTGVGAVIVALLLFPVYWMANASLQSHVALLSPHPPLFPTAPIFSGYANALATQGWNIATSLGVASATTAFSLILAAPFAYALTEYRLRWTALLVLMMLMVQMIPNIVMANALYTIFAKLGLLNSYLGLVMADSTVCVPFSVLILRAFMASLPRGLTEAGLVDGAGYWQIFLEIILPISRNGLVTAAMFSFLFAWSDFMFALTLVTTQKAVPVTLGIYQYIGAHDTDWNSVMATAVIASAPPILLLLLGQGAITAGLTGGAVKE
jgi:multiple sugar transport system permease protein